MINYFVPLPLRRDMPGRVMDSLKAQTEPVEIHECRTPGEDDVNKGRTPLAVKGRLASRELCRQEAAALKPQPEYVVMADSDRACIDSNRGCIMETDVADARKFQHNHNQFCGWGFR